MQGWEAWARAARPKPSGCTHPQTMIVTTDGLERVICRACGHVSFRYDYQVSGDVERSQFSRLADRLDHGAHVKH